MTKLERIAENLARGLARSSLTLLWPSCRHLHRYRRCSFNCGEPAEMELFACVSVSRVFRNSRDPKPLDRMKTNCRDARESWSGVGS